ncbi:MAG: LacI family DNA-binding transcriptional regulator [Planctomycetes bacterium]|nr:LacI family DNA-binding transcriptional regulator [Planctomycetota bacterium]
MTRKRATKAVRLKDIAVKTGMSIATVCKILKGPPTSDLFAEGSVKRVKQMADRLGYRPNYHARSLQTGKSMTVGVAMAGSIESNIWFFGQMLGGIQNQARLLGHSLLLISPEKDRDSLATGLEYARCRQIDCLIVPHFAYSEESVRQMENVNLSVVLTTLYERKTSLPTVLMDPKPGIAQAVQHLADLGHRRLTWFGPVPGTDQILGDSREAVFSSAVKSLGLKGDSVYFSKLPAGAPDEVGEWVQGGREAMLKHLAGVPKDQAPTCLVCSDERHALGAYSAILECGLKIPGDVSVVGFDNIFAPVACPTMTVVSHMLPEIGRKAVEMAIAMADDPALVVKLRGHREYIPSQLIVSKSTVRPRA